MLIAVIALLLTLLSGSSPAATPEEEYRKLQEKLQEHNRKLGETLRIESSLLSELEDVNRKIGKVEVDLRKYRAALHKAETEVADLKAEIIRTEAAIRRQKDWIRRKLRSMHRFGYSGDTLVLLLSSTDLSQMMRVWKYLEAISVHEHRMLTAYNDNLESLNEKQERLKVLTAQLKATTDRVRAKEDELARQRESKEVLLTSVRTEKAAHQKMIAELKAASRRLQEILREAAKTDTYTGAGFARGKGKLPWPAEGRIAAPYGSQKDPQFSTPVFRNGVHIQTSSGADARAVFEGKVIFAEWFKGFGQLVIVNHGNGYHTLYGNLAEIFSKAGDIIKGDQVIGRVGTSGVLNAPGLYFEVRYKGKPLDPLQWLRQRRR